MTTQSVLTATIAPGASETAEIDVVNPGLNAILIIGNWTPADISFQVLSQDGETFIDFYYQGVEVVLTIGANQFRDVDPTIWLGVTKFRIRSGTSALPVPQVLPATLQVIGYFNTNPPTQGLVPNIRRTIYLDFAEQVCNFPPMTLNETDVLTFDLSGILNVGEIILQITSFVLVPVGPIGTSDTDPAARAVGNVTISGSTISQQFGNFSSLTANDGYIKYLAVATITTTQRNQLVLSSYLEVDNLPTPWDD